MNFSTTELAVGKKANARTETLRRVFDTEATDCIEIRTLHKCVVIHAPERASYWSDADNMVLSKAAAIELAEAILAAAQEVSA